MLLDNLMKQSFLRKSLYNSFYNGLNDSCLKALTTGPLLTAFAVALGAGDITLGFLAATIPFCSLMYLPVAYFLEKGTDLKKFTVYCSLAARPFMFLAAITAFFTPSPTILTFFVISYFLSYLFNTAQGAAFWPWMKELVPPAIINIYLAKRIRYIMLVKLITVTLATFTLNFVQDTSPHNELKVYGIFFIIATIFGLFASWNLYCVQPKSLSVIRHKLSFFNKICFAFRNKSFKSLLWTLSLINIAYNFMFSFFTVYVLTGLGLSADIMLALTLLSQIIDFMTIEKWSNRVKKSNVFSVMIQASLLFCLSIALLFIINLVHLNIPQTCILAVLVLVYTFLGLASSGLMLAINDAAISFVPRKMSAIYISVCNTARFSAAALASFSAGFSLNFLKMNFDKQNAWTIFFIISALWFGLSILYIRKKCVQK